MKKLKIEELLKCTQYQLLGYCYQKLLERNFESRNILCTPNYLYAKGDIPILLVAHTDTVYKEAPNPIVYDRIQKILWSPTGIGGDDRCGVYAILKLCEQKLKPYVLFTTQEEVGGLGVKKFVKEMEVLPVQFIIEIDRRGCEQVVFYDCGNEDFQNYIQSFGFNLQYGSYSDVSTLSTHYDIAGCNVSAGYYNEHTSSEYIKLNDLNKTIHKVRAILNDTENHKKYDCQEVEFDWSKYYNTKYPKQSQYEIKLQELEEDWYELTDKQWENKYQCKRPLNFYDIYFMEVLNDVD